MEKKINMNKLLKTILIISITIFSVGLLSANFVQAQAANELVVEYWTGTEWLPLMGPIFSETNFLPGEDVTRLVRVTNNSGQPQRIIVEAINVSDPKNLGQVLNLEIKESLETHYNDTLANFSNAGEFYLSDLVTGANTQYDFSIGFISGAKGPQGATLAFDILIGFQGAGGGVLPGEYGGSGGGGPPGLIIKYEKDIYINTNSAIISWFTSYPATSRIIYSRYDQPHNFDLTDVGGSPPLYGYVNTTPEYHTPANPYGELYREIEITGLLPNTTYYFRCISHASPPTISQEHSFTTLTAGEVKEEVGEIEEEIGPAEEAVGPLVGPAAARAASPTEEVIEPEETEPEEEVIKPKETVQIEDKTNNFLAAISGLFGGGNYCWILSLFLTLFLILYLLYRRKKEKIKYDWDLVAILVGLIILVFLSKCYLLLISIIITIAYWLYYYYKKYKFKEDKL